MRFQIKKVTPVGTRTGGAFVNRGFQQGGFETITTNVYPSSRGGDLLREARKASPTFVTLRMGAARLGMTAEQLSGLEHGRYAFDDPVDFETAAEILRGKWPKRADGWPLCPVCNEDELGCMDMATDYATLGGNQAACLQRELLCHRCSRRYPGGTFTAAEVET